MRINEPEEYNSDHIANFYIMYDVMAVKLYKITIELTITSFCRWEEFTRSMFWLAVIGGSLILLRALLLVLLRCRRHSSEEHKTYGALIFPRFELFLIILALPCICQASMALVKGTTPCIILVLTQIINCSIFQRNILL